MQGLHLTADLRGCAAERRLMTEPEALRGLCLDAVRGAGLTAVGDLFHGFEAANATPPSAMARAALAKQATATAQAAGVTGVVLLAESHLAVHTWPEFDAATLDVYVCNIGTDNSARAEALMTALVAAFAPSEANRHSHRRG